MRLAPILLFVYNRPWHTMQTVEALQRNELAAEFGVLGLFIFTLRCYTTVRKAMIFLKK